MEEIQSTTRLEEDRLYQESLAHLQRGQWEEAVESILRLQEQYGSDSEVETLLQEARFKAALDQEPLSLQRLSWGEKWRRWRPLVIWGALGSLVVVALLAGLVMYQQQVVPARLVQEAELQLEQLRQQGQVELAARQYDEAVLTFKTLLEQIPGDETALEGIARAEEKQRLESLTQQAIALLESKDWEAALGVMDRVRAWKPDYLGLDDNRVLAEKQLRLEASFEEAEAAYAMGDWERALVGYGRVQALDQGYQKAMITERLFEAYIYRGQELIAAAGGSLDPIGEARELFTKALVLRPGDPLVVAERDWADAYIDGYRAYEDEDWDHAAATLGQLYADRTDYPGVLSLLLYEARVQQGQELELQGDVEGALAAYQRALGVRGIDHSQAEARFAALSPDPPAETEDLPDTPIPPAEPDPDGRYDLDFMGARPNCNLTGVIGVIKDSSGLPVQGTQVQIRNLAGKSWTSPPSDADGHYKVTMAGKPIADTWTAHVVGVEQPASPQYSFQTSSGCVEGLQEYQINWQRR